jgi:hypothetical protein
MADRRKAAAFDLDPASLISLREALAGWEIKVVNGATAASLSNGGTLPRRTSSSSGHGRMRQRPSGCADFWCFAGADRTRHDGRTLCSSFWCRPDRRAS